MGGGLPRGGGGGDMGSFGIDWYRNDLKSFVMKSKEVRLSGYLVTFRNAFVNQQDRNKWSGSWLQSLKK